MPFSLLDKASAHRLGQSDQTWPLAALAISAALGEFRRITWNVVTVPASCSVMSVVAANSDYECSKAAMRRARVTVIMMRAMTPRIYSGHQRLASDDVSAARVQGEEYEYERRALARSAGGSMCIREPRVCGVVW
jgi:hypothetical protein